MKTLKYLRQEKNMTQIDLAVVSGVPRSRIQLCEQGIAILKKSDIPKLAKALFVSEKALGHIPVDGVDPAEKL